MEKKTIRTTVFGPGRSIIRASNFVSQFPPQNPVRIVRSTYLLSSSLYPGLPSKWGFRAVLGSTWGLRPLVPFCAP